MRVLLVQGGGERGGAERVLLALARHLPDHGVDPAVAALTAGPFIDELRANDVEVLDLPRPPRVRNPRGHRAVAEAVAEAATEIGAGVIHANGEKMGLYGGGAARRTGLPSIVWLQDAALRSPASAAIQFRLRTARHDALVACSASMATTFRRRLRLRAEVIHHSIDLDILPDGAADIRAEAGWDRETVVIGHFARLQQWKGTDVFLRAAARVAAANPRARFAVVGGALFGREPEYAASLPDLADELGLGDRVRFFGHRDDALELMAGSDVVVHASVRHEPFGLVVAEAMGLERAVVATRSGGPEEMIAHDRSGLLVEPGDVPSMADAVARLAGDPMLRERFGQAAADDVRARWSAATMAGRFAQLYRSLAGDTCGAPS